jgi:hypothetical protein
MGRKELDSRQGSRQQGREQGSRGEGMRGKSGGKRARSHLQVPVAFVLEGNGFGDLHLGVLLVLLKVRPA